jgi:hypothetical protein
MELITKLSGLLKAITHTIRVVLNPTPEMGRDSFVFSILYSFTTKKYKL